MTTVSEQRQIIAAEMADVHTCLPGVLVSYDGQFAQVRPTLAKQLANGQVLGAPLIARVPVCWPCGDVGGGQALISVPLRAGDPVLLIFSERALDDWLNGSDGPPGDPRQFDLSDAFAMPMMRPGVVAAADLNRLSMRYGPGSITISDAGEIVITAPAGLRVVAPDTTTTGNVLVGQNLGITGTTIGAGVNLNTHRHGNVEQGPDISGTPVP